MVSDYGEPRSADRLGNARADHGGAGGTVQLRLTPGANIPISVDPFPVDGLVPTEDEIKGAVRLLQNHRSAGLSGMQA